MTIPEIIGGIYLLFGTVLALTGSSTKWKRGCGSWLKPIGDLASLGTFSFMIFVALWPFWCGLFLIFREKKNKAQLQRNISERS